MCTSDIDKKNNYERREFVFFCVSLFLILLGAIYEACSHNVFSFSMIYAFVYPLVPGAFVNRIMRLVSAKEPKHITCELYTCGIITLTLGSLISGAFQIYGSGNILINVFFIVGPLLILTAVVKYFIYDKRH